MELKRRRSKTFIIDKHKYLYKQDKSQMALFQLWQAGVLLVLLPLQFFVPCELMSHSWLVSR